MSDPVTALRGASDTVGIAEIRELGPLGMITLRGDLSAAAVQKTAKKATGVAFPEVRMCHTDGESGLAWMSPDELLVMCPYDQAGTALEEMQKALAKSHALVVNVSDARAVFEIKGPRAREVLAKVSPVDLHVDAFEPGMFRRTRLAQVAAAFWMRDAETFQIVCFRSVAQYVFDVLVMAAQPGSEVDHF